MENNRFFPEMNGYLGFGFMRLPMKGEEIDFDEVCRMVDAYLEAGFNYFDTAHGYHNGESEIMLRKSLVERHERSEYLMANKLSENYFSTEEEIRPLFETQLAQCGVDYFDFFLMHAQNRDNYKQYTRCRAYEIASELKKEGKIRHVGLSFHDTADILDMILTEHPEVEFVQIQFNYLDYEDENVQSRKCYEVCEKHNKPIVVMEPVKGGKLVNLPEKAAGIFRDLQGGSEASYAVRFVASFPQIAVVLSGMSDLSQVEDNTRTMGNFRPFDAREMEAVARVSGILRELKLIPCTSCRYCIEENSCPMGIRIPDLFAVKNARDAFQNWRSSDYRAALGADGQGKASSCIKCGQCETVCPQHLPIRRLLEDVAATFE